MRWFAAKFARCVNLRLPHGVQPHHPRMNVDPFLRSTDVIDWQHPAVTERARMLREVQVGAVAIARSCFEWVRDEIKHTGDFQLLAVTCAASEVLRELSGYC